MFVYVSRQLPADHLRRNLSVLKQRWEQQQEPSRLQKQMVSCDLADRHAPISASPLANPRSPVSPPDPKPEPSPHCEDLRTSTLCKAQDGEYGTPMEACGDSDGQRGAAVPDSEKPSVPLTSLKMMFEQGENPGGQVRLFSSSTSFQQTGEKLMGG